MAHAHAHSAGHGHHHHHHGPADVADPGRGFLLGIGLNLAFVGAEAAAGLLSGSLSLLADAGHNLSDVLGLALAFGAALLARRAATARRTYGWRRATILAALANAVLLLLAVGAIAFEAVRRLRDPAPVEAPVVIAVALAGVVVNGVTAALFAQGREADLNRRGAYLHMVADAAVSLGVALSAGLILLTGWRLVDPLVSLAVVAVIAWGTWGLLRDSLDLALDAVPAGVDPERVRAFLAGLPGVTDVHHLHLWPLSTTEAALTAHLVRPAGADDALLEQACRELRAHYGVHHATLQVETAGAHCHAPQPGPLPA